MERCNVESILHFFLGRTRALLVLSTRTRGLDKKKENNRNHDWRVVSGDAAGGGGQRVK